MVGGEELDEWDRVLISIQEKWTSHLVVIYLVPGLMNPVWELGDSS